MNPTPEKKVALVTGAASGIGLATVRRFLRDGYRPVLVDRNAEALEKARAALAAEFPGTEILTQITDVAQEKEVQTTVDHALHQFHRLDVIVNNAGLMIFKPLEEHTLDDWQRVLSVDLLGAFFFIREAFRRMGRGGAIVNVASVHAIETTPLVAAYAAAKSALVSLTHSASIEGKPKGIRVNAVLPGAIDTPMLWENPNVKSGLEVIHKTEVGKPEDIADAIAFLASPGAEFVQGASLNVDGGRLSRL